MLHLLYRSIWLLLYFLARCCELFRWLLLRLQAGYRKSYDSLSSAGQLHWQRDAAFLERCKSELLKIPRHLIIIIGPEEVFGAEQLSRIALYALNMEIDCISFYDTRSTIASKNDKHKKKSCGVSMEQLQPPKFVCITKLRENRLRWSVPRYEYANGKILANGKIKANGSSGIRYSNGMNGSLKNGVNSVTSSFKGDSIEIVMLDVEDGRPLIAEVCRELYQQRQTEEIQNLLKDRTLLTERISMELSKKLHNLSDPDLGIIFHRHTCTFGLLPWHTRFTEFYTIETGRYFNVETFAEVLYKYSRCEQRWGK